MVQLFTYKKKEQYASPDEIRIKDLHIWVTFREINTITFTLINNTLYLGDSASVHPILYAKNNLRGNGFDGRLWCDKKYFTFWFNDWDNTKEAFINICKINTYIKKKSFIPFTRHNLKKNIVDEINSLNIDITEYMFFFLVKDKNDIKVMMCDYDYIKKQAYNTTISVSPTIRRFFVRPPKSKKISYKAYIEDCNYWKNKIGNMDVALYHLLAYEE